MKTTITALCAAALIATAPAVLAQGVSSKTPDLQHKLSRKTHGDVSGYAPRHPMQAKGSKRGYSRAIGYAPAEPTGSDKYLLEMSRQAGGGGGGGGSGM
jgi:hypothetical protein